MGASNGWGRTSRAGRLAWPSAATRWRACFRALSHLPTDSAMVRTRILGMRPGRHAIGPRKIPPAKSEKAPSIPAQAPSDADDAVGMRPFPLRRHPGGPTSSASHGGARSAARADRRLLSSITVLALGAAGLVGGLVHYTGTPAPLCAPTGEIIRVGNGPVGCMHDDTAPKGVDINKPVSTAALLARPGAGPKAVIAAQDLGVATVASTGTGPDVTCDGDGVSGFRTQALYVVEANATNRYASLKSTLQNWAAGVDDVINRSAALTGGVRHIRYVTEPGGTGCVAAVLNVTVPAGALANFNTSIQAVQNLGYTDPSRKYLMWTDTSGKGICGIAQTYPYDTDGQGNPNNGSYAQYARIDNPCWGLGNGAEEHSVEAHELTHTLGSVMSTAPHGTRAGHCWDEYDTMCYADGGGFAMKVVCPISREYLLDCNSDDYFSTFPDPGSWLDTHWNVADSRFLIGGGDGAGGGAVGKPTVLGAILGVNNPAIPGLSTQVSATPVLPDGRTLASVSWKAGRSDCKFTTPTEIQSDVTCSAASAANTTVTATLVDSAGGKKTVTGQLTFTASSARAVTAGLTVAGQRSSDVTSASVCTSAPTPAIVTLTDAATGSPIYGLAASMTKQVGTAKATTAGTPASALDGTSVTSQTLIAATSFSVMTTATKIYAAAPAVSMNTTVGKCSPALTGSASTLAPWYGDTVTVTGTLTREVNGAAVPVANASLPVSVNTSSVVSGKTVIKSTGLGTAKTGLDGSYILAIKPVTAGTLKVALPASTSYTATDVTLGDVAPRTPATALTAAVSSNLSDGEAGYGQTVSVSGVLTKDADSTVGVANQTIAIKITAPGTAAAQVGSARTAADGTYTASFPLRVSGDLTAVFAGVAGLPAKTVDLGNVTATSWTTALSAATPSPAGVSAGQASTITGTASRTYAGATEPLKSTTITVTITPAGGTATTTKITTTTAGSFSYRVAPKVTTTVTFKVTGISGHVDSNVSTTTVTVG
jgi:hypothetical protein